MQYEADAISRKVASPDAPAASNEVLSNCTSPAMSAIAPRAYLIGASNVSARRAWGVQERRSGVGPYGLGPSVTGGMFVSSDPSAERALGARVQRPSVKDI